MKLFLWKMFLPVGWYYINSETYEARAFWNGFKWSDRYGPINPDTVALLVFRIKK